MCEPLTIASLALTAGSVAANTMAQSKAASARSDAMAAERIRQQGYDRETDALNAASQKRYEGFEGQQGERGKELGDYFQEQAAQPGAAAGMPTSVLPTSSNITVQEQARQGAKAQAKSDQQAEALGDLRSFGDLLGSIGLLQARDASQIGQIGGFKKGSASVNALELDAANQKGAGLKTVGDILGGLGSIAGSAGGTAGLTNALGLTSGATSGVSTAANLPSMLRPATATPLSLTGTSATMPSFLNPTISNPFRVV